MREPPDGPQFRFVEIGHEPVTADDGPADAVKQGPRSVFDRLGHNGLLAALLIATMAVGIGLGYLADRPATKTKTVTRAVPVPVTPTSTLPASTYDQVGMTGLRCSAQLGHQLQLGVEVSNGLTVPVTLTRLWATFPMGGLRLVSSAREACGQLPGPTGDDIAGYELAPGAAVWLTVTADVLVGCPEAAAVRMGLSYIQSGRTLTAFLGPFPDLGGLPYTGCTRR